MQNPSPLRIALGNFIGSVLTPQVAVAIELASLEIPDTSIDPLKFGQVVYGGSHTIQAEKLVNILQPLHALHERHWLETEGHRHGLALNIDYEAMLAHERAGRLIQFTVRSISESELVGNLRMYVTKSAHTSLPMAVAARTVADEDTLYLRPDHRGSFLVMALLRFAESALRSIGVREINCNSKLANHADVLLKRMGYRHVGHLFSKILGD